MDVVAKYIFQTSGTDLRLPESDGISWLFMDGLKLMTLDGAGDPVPVQVTAAAETLTATLTSGNVMNNGQQIESEDGFSTLIINDDLVDIRNSAPTGLAYWGAADSRIPFPVKMGEDGPADTSSVLDLSTAANDKGLLIPRLTTIEKDAIASPTEGLVVYDTDIKSIQTYNGAAWTSGGAAGFLTYKALLTQSGTNPPVATILENTLSDVIVWTYGGSAGYYIGTLAGAFPAGKTAYVVGNRGELTTCVTEIQFIDADSFGFFISNDYTGGFAAGNNGAMIDTSFTIEVYP